MKKIELFFCYCSGASLSLLKRCPTEASKYVGIGATIFFTGLLAAISSAYALFFVFDSIVLPIVLGMIWGLMIFNLDRFIVLSMRKSNQEDHKEYIQAAPRLVLAILIALVISKPLELKIFEKEIATELSLIEQELMLERESAIAARYVDLMDSLNSEKKALLSELLGKQTIRDKLLDIARQEADGTGGSGKVNPGPIYQIKKRNADLAQIELEELRSVNTAKIESIENQLAKWSERKQQEVNSLEKKNINGISFQLTALGRLGEKYPIIYLANLFIVLLFVALEISPVLAKILAPRGPYDDLLEIHEKHFEGYRKQNVYKEEKRVEDYILSRS